MIRIVCDTNTLVSGFLFHGNESTVIELVSGGALELFLSQEIVEEFSRVLDYEKLKPRYTSKEEIMNQLLEISKKIQPTKKINAVKDDPSDNKFLECGIEAKAHYIISGDKHLLKIKEYRKQKKIFNSLRLNILCFKNC